MYIARVPDRNSPPAILLRESYREDGKVKNRTLLNLTGWPEDRLAQFARLLRGEQLVPVDAHFRIIRSLPHGHVAAAASMMRELSMDKLIGGTDPRKRALVEAMIVSRIISPVSKLATSRSFSSELAESTLAEEFGVTDASEDELYGAMDWLLARQSAIEAKLAARHLSEDGLVLYDLSAVHYDGATCPLAKIGHPRDGFPGKRQVEFGLVCDKDGRPVATEVYAGNTGDPKTVADQVTKLKSKFGLKRVVVVGDRGMLTDARIRDDLVPANLDWISCLRSTDIRKLLAENGFQPSLFDSSNMAEIQHPDFPSERLIICRNPFLGEERARKRSELLIATEEKLKAITEAVARKSNPLRGKAAIGVRVGKVINSHKVGKHFQYSIEDDAFTFSRNEEKIQAETALDGIYVVRTSLSKDVMQACQAVDAYKSLSKVERAFRCAKHLDLKIHPIAHRLEDRVRAHVLLCMLAYYVEWHMRERLASAIFHDDAKDDAKKDRLSPVDKAIRSKRAKAKDLTKVDENGSPVVSFSGALRQLGTITKNTLVFANDPGAVTIRITEPTPFQSRLLGLVGASL
jgi:transposase